MNADNAEKNQDCRDRRGMVLAVWLAIKAAMKARMRVIERYFLKTNFKNLLTIQR